MKLTLAFSIAFVFFGNLIRAAEAPVIYHAAGETAAEILPVVEQFRRDIGLGGRDNGNVPGRFNDGWREINWEDDN